VSTSSHIANDMVVRFRRTYSRRVTSASNRNRRGLSIHRALAHHPLQSLTLAMPLSAVTSENYQCSE